MSGAFVIPPDRASATSEPASAATADRYQVVHVSAETLTEDADVSAETSTPEARGAFVRVARANPPGNSLLTRRDHANSPAADDFHQRLTDLVVLAHSAEAFRLRSVGEDRNHRRAVVAGCIMEFEILARLYQREPACFVV